MEEYIEFFERYAKEVLEQKNNFQKPFKVFYFKLTEDQTTIYSCDYWQFDRAEVEARLSRAKKERNMTMITQTTMLLEAKNRTILIIPISDTEYFKETGEVKHILVELNTTY